MKVIYVLILAIILLISCEKEDDTPSTESPKEPIPYTYTPMKIGNYWIYQHYKVDTNDIETELTKRDSICVVGDTIINNKTYNILERIRISNINPSKYYSYYRDSTGYLINDRGTILFSETNFTDTLQLMTEVYEEDTFYIVTCVMENYNNSISLPSGTFNNILNFKGTLWIGANPNNVKNPRYLNNYYSKNIGLIYRNYYYLNKHDRFEERLIAYHIN